MTPPPQSATERVRGLAALLWRGRVRLAYAVVVLGFLWAVARFWQPGTGFTSLISIGSKLDVATVTALKQVPHHVYDETFGYDGAYYVQIALHPLLGEPELGKAIDNPTYRAKRILMCWAAWLLGCGRDAWVVQAFALVNVLAWLALAWVLLRRFPPTCWANLLRWGCVLLTHGACVSVRNSLVDVPALLLTAVAVAALERGSRIGGVSALAAAALTKETSLLATTAFAQPPLRGAREWGRVAAAGLLALAPLALWMAFVRWRLGANGDPGFNNFTWPLVGLAEKLAATVAEVRTAGWDAFTAGNTIMLVALVTQAVFLLVRREPQQLWWRIGAAYAVLMLVVAQPVWEGYPGAATRVLLPMTLAFNLLVPRARRWLPVLIAGNLTVLIGTQEFAPPAGEVFRVQCAPALRPSVAVERGAGWYQVEVDGTRRWRWGEERATLRLVNSSPQPLAARLAGEVNAIRPRRLTLKAGPRSIWSADLEGRPKKFETAAFDLPAGASIELEFTTDRPGLKYAGGDPRTLSFSLFDLAIAVAPPGALPQPRP